jgi:hypothetical protein
MIQLNGIMRNQLLSKIGITSINLGFIPYKQNEEDPIFNAPYFLLFFSCKRKALTSLENDGESQ